MEKSKIDKLTTIGQFMMVFISIVGVIWTIQSNYNNFNKHLDLMEERILKTEQMSLKAVIWSPDVPLVERLASCDEYIHLGFNSYTRKHCESLLGKEK